MAASMRVRFELFVQEMGVAVAFYTEALSTPGRWDSTCYAKSPDTPAFAGAR